jgi:hypothetical protein
MKLTRLFESTESESISSLSQETFVELAAKHKALLLQSDDGTEPFSVEDFAQLTESLSLRYYECKVFDLIFYSTRSFLNYVILSL